MCGILAASFKEARLLTDISRSIKNMEYRGYDSWGLVAIDKKTKLYRGVGMIGDKKIEGESKTVLAHTRWATHGGIKIKNCHPFPSCHKNLWLIHNGIVENFEELKIKNHRYLSETDSEVMVHFLEKYKDLKAGVLDLAKKIKGKNSVVVFDKNSNTFIGYKNGSPLIAGYGDGVIEIVSDVGALDKDVKKIYHLKDNEMVVMNNTDNIGIIDVLSSRELKIKWEDFTNKETDMVEGQMMYREIKESKTVLERIDAEVKSIDDFRNEILRATEVIFVGCGSASFAGEMATLLLSSKLSKRSRVYVASEVKEYIKSFDKKALIVVLSQSGETMDLIEVTGIFLNKGFRVVGLINNPLSSLARMVDKVYPLLAGREVAVAATKSFTAMVYWFLKIVGTKEKDITDEKEAVKLAKLFTKIDRLLIIGRGENYILAKEAALKFKEACYIQAEAVPGGELKHGSLALIQPGIPVLTIGSGMENDSAEIKARGGKIIGIDTGGIINNLITIQLLAFFIAKNKNINPDRPRNLAKSVTVR